MSDAEVICNFMQERPNPQSEVWRYTKWVWWHVRDELIERQFGDRRFAGATPVILDRDA